MGAQPWLEPPHLLKHWEEPHALHGGHLLLQRLQELRDVVRVEARHLSLRVQAAASPRSPRDLLHLSVKEGGMGHKGARGALKGMSGGQGHAPRAQSERQHQGGARGEGQSERKERGRES